tara:strand:- start:215 stop:2365 length:2151 start_codon:yes stop_codon:yes gene_type:complete
MSLTNFSNLDFNQIKQTIKDYLKSNSNFTDYDFEGSNMSTIIDVLAYNTYTTSYNANMIANEVFLDSATLRENVVSLAKLTGYLPKSRKAARATISFFVDTTNYTPIPLSLTLKRGIVAVSSGSFAGQSHVFSIPEDITVQVSNGIAIFTDIPIYEGVLVSQNFTYSSRQPYQKFILDNSGIDTDLITVFVRDNESSTASTRFTQQNNLFDVKPDSRVYFLQEISNERYEVFFGDNNFGKKLEDGTYVTINYIRSTGSQANGITNFSFSGVISYSRNGDEYRLTDGVSLLSTGLASSGGDEIESVESIKKFAPRVYSTQNRAITASDYETLIPTTIYPEAESISVFGGEELIPPQYGKVFISIKPKFGDFLPNLIKENIKRKLKSYSVVGVLPEILDLKYLYLEVQSSIYYNSNFTSSSQLVSNKVLENVEKYANSTELNRYGARFKYSRFLKLIDDTHESITSNITTVSMRRDLRVVLNSFAEYSIGFGNGFQVNKLDGYNIKSSAFRVSGLNVDVYLGDLPNTNRRTGSLFFFTVPNINSTSPTILRRNVGFINYASGIITLNPINITSAKSVNGQATIEISANPKSNDVIGLQDLYLQLDTSNSIFEMVVDAIESGVDNSGSSYISASSYPNGALVRSGGRTGELDITQQSLSRPATPTRVSSTYTTSQSSTSSTSSTSSSAAPSSPSPSPTPSSPSPSPTPSGGGGGGSYGY